eukprot:ANDGO_00569.mRNA.1 hypothetical protein DQ04_09241000
MSATPILDRLDTVNVPFFLALAKPLINASTGLVEDSPSALYVPYTVLYEHHFPISVYARENANSEAVSLSGKDIDQRAIFTAMTADADDRCPIVAVFLSSSSEDEASKPSLHVEYFSASSLKDFMFNRKTKGSGSGLLQRFILPRGDHNTMIQLVWTPHMNLVEQRKNHHVIFVPKDEMTRTRNRHIPMAERAATFDGPTYLSEPVICADSVKAQAASLMSFIVDHVERVCGVTIKRVVTQWKLSSKNKLHFLWCSSFHATRGSKPTVHSSQEYKGVSLQLVPPDELAATAGSSSAISPKPVRKATQPTAKHGAHVGHAAPSNSEWFCAECSGTVRSSDVFFLNLELALQAYNMSARKIWNKKRKQRSRDGYVSMSDFDEDDDDFCAQPAQPATLSRSSSRPQISLDTTAAVNSRENSMHSPRGGYIPLSPTADGTQNSSGRAASPNAGNGHPPAAAAAPPPSSSSSHQSSASIDSPGALTPASANTPSNASSSVPPPIRVHFASVQEKIDCLALVQDALYEVYSSFSTAASSEGSWADYPPAKVSARHWKGTKENPDVFVVEELDFDGKAVCFSFPDGLREVSDKIHRFGMRHNLEEWSVRMSDAPKRVVFVASSRDVSMFTTITAENAESNVSKKILVARCSKIPVRRLQMILEELREYIRQWVEDYSVCPNEPPVTAVSPKSRTRRSGSTAHRRTGSRVNPDPDQEITRRARERRKQELLSHRSHTSTAENGNIDSARSNRMQVNTERSVPPEDPGSPVNYFSSAAPTDVSVSVTVDDTGIPKKILHFAPLLEKKMPEAFLRLDENRLKLTDVRVLLDDLVKCGPLVHTSIQEIVSREVAKGSMPVADVSAASDRSEVSAAQVAHDADVEEARRKLRIPMCANCYVAATEPFHDVSNTSAIIAKLLPSIQRSTSPSGTRRPYSGSTRSGERTLFLSSSLSRPSTAMSSHPSTTYSTKPNSRATSPGSKSSPGTRPATAQSIRHTSPKGSNDGGSHLASRRERPQSSAAPRSGGPHFAKSSASSNPLGKPVQRPPSAQYRQISHQYREWPHSPNQS